MLDEYLEKLRHMPPAIPLDGLEAAIWARVGVDEQVLRSRNLIVGCQAGIVALLIAGGITIVGLFSTPVQATPNRLDAFSAEGMPAPSTLLLGKHL